MDSTVCQSTNTRKGENTKGEKHPQRIRKIFIPTKKKEEI